MKHNMKQINYLDGTGSIITCIPEGHSNSDLQGKALVQYWINDNDTHILNDERVIAFGKGPKIDGSMSMKGWTIEELIAVAQLRLYQVNNVCDCKENIEAAKYLQKALNSLNARREDRVNRKVINTSKK